MRIRLITITHHVPPWVKEGFQDYLRRLPHPWQLELIEIPAEKRTAHHPIARLREREGERLLSAAKATHRLIALDVKGECWSSEQLSQQMVKWQEDGRPIDLLVGGPDGLAASCLARAEKKWSLSALTFPHALVRIILAEQIYRAYAILQHHPYHR